MTNTLEDKQQNGSDNASGLATPVAVQRHTPGPWRAGFEPNHHPREVRGEDHDELCCVGHHTFDAVDIFTRQRGPTWEEHVANIRLIAAAPDLLEALKPFAEASNHLHPSHADDATTLDGIEVRHWRAAFAAVAKALWADGPQAQASASEVPPSAKEYLSPDTKGGK